jgi:hypothetical protein
MKLQPKPDENGVIVGYVFYCPGCKHTHIFYTKSWETKNGPTPAWEFNGNMVAPTFTPSLLNTCEKHPDPKQRRCHLNLTNGKLIFHGDSVHDLKGQTVDLQERPSTQGP